jgi:hypothetical protein
MSDFRIVEQAGLQPKDCKVRLYLYDALTGEVLPRFKPPKYGFNTATPLAAKVAARTLVGSLSEGTPYIVSRIEWGQGSTGLAFNEADPDLESPFASRVYTDLEEPEFTATPGQVILRSSIDISSFSGGGPVTVQEVGLRTNPVAGHSDGILVARYQNDTAIQLSGTRLRIGVEWVYIYASI